MRLVPRELHPGAMADTTAPNVQLVKNTYVAFSRGDIASVVDVMHPEIAWHEAEHSPWHAPGGHLGPPAVLTNVFARIPELFEDFAVEPLRFHNAGGTVVVEARYRGRAAGTSTPLDAQACHVWTIRDGRLIAFQQYTDTWQFAQVAVAQRV
jgi:ketosteroid isomerase-like protein